MLRKAPRWLWLALVACAHPAAPTPRSVATLQRPPRPVDVSPPPRKGNTEHADGPTRDPESVSAAYVAKLAAQFDAGWRQFLNDCRLRLPGNHPLNQMRLAATIEIAIDRTGGLVGVEFIASSGNADFDRAVREVVTEPSALEAPPIELVSDDDRAHVRWLFARDQRHAGAATAKLFRVELPLAGVVSHLIGAGELSRAARRIAVAPRDAEREAATSRVMVAALREALRGLDGSVRRAAVEAVGQARVAELVADVRSMLTLTSDTELRMAALATVAELSDSEAVPAILAQLSVDLTASSQLAVAATRTLVRLGRRNDAAVNIRRALASGNPNPIALDAFGVAPSFGLERKLDVWFHRGSSRVRAAVCTALAGIPPALAVGRVRRGMVDRDATVRAACAAAAAQLSTATPRVARSFTSALRAMTHDRDRAARARAVEAIAVLDPLHPVDASSDPAPEVRAAYARALAATDPALRALTADRAPEVRAAAWTTLRGKGTSTAAPLDLSQRANQAMRDLAPQVRLAAIAAVRDIDVLRAIVQHDDAPELRTAGLVQLTRHRGRSEVADDLLQRFAAADPGSIDRVRAALAWLLAT